MNLLIVDDSPGLRKVIRHSLQDKFSDIFEAADRLEAFRMYEEKHPEWVTMDLEMPLVDGLTSIRLIKNKYPDAKIIMVSKFSDDEIMKLSKYVGADAFFMKEDLLEIGDYIETHSH